MSRDLRGVMTRRSLLAILVTIGSCSDSSEHANALIDHVVSGGFSGRGDGTDLHIETDGTMTRPKASGGTETAALDEASLRDLRDKIVSADFPALAPMYSCGCADSYLHQIDVYLDGTTHRVFAENMAPIPDGLKRVLDTLEQIARAPHDWR